MYSTLGEKNSCIRFGRTVRFPHICEIVHTQHTHTHIAIFPNGLSAVRLQRVECWLAAIHSIHIIYYMFIEYERGVELISTAVDVFAEPACECGFCSRFQYKH